MARRKWKTCPDCGVAIDDFHVVGCDVERCPHCGRQALQCPHFDPDDYRRQVFDGYWPGDLDCERLGLKDSDGGPALNRLVRECQWNADKQRWERLDAAE